jgi:hypothetical protein
MMFGLFGKKSSYIDALLAKKDPQKFIDGIGKDPKAFFTEAQKDHKKALRALAVVLEMAGHSLGQTALLLGMVGAMKVAAKDKRAPKGAVKTAEALGADIQRLLKMAS